MVDFINSKLNIKESYEMPDALMAVLKSKEEREELFRGFLERFPDLSKDCFFDYFQEEHGDRGKLKQDFTPDSLINLVCGLAEKTENVADICSGTGGLTLKLAKGREVYCEEISGRTIPILLFNLAIRNASGTVVHGDSLSGEVEAVFKLEKTEEFSNITKVDGIEEKQFELVVSNPPYSLDWDSEKLKTDNRFNGWPLAPKSKADYAFLLHGLSKLKEGGTMLVIFPHGVLFRGGTEGKIRQVLAERNLIDFIIGLPGKLFKNTDIPTLILGIKKSRKNKDILFVDAEKEFKQIGKNNVLQPENIEKIISVVKNRLAAEKFSALVDIEELEKNEFNMNIPRYVDTYEPEEIPDLYETLKEWAEIEEEINKTNQELLNMINQLVGTNPDAQKRVEAVKDTFEKITQYKQLEFGNVL